MLNIEKYKEEILKEYNKRLENTDEGLYSEQFANAIFKVFCCDECRRDSENVVEWAFREYKPVLSDEAKDFLKAIMQHFEDPKIYKVACYDNSGDILRVYAKNGNGKIRYDKSSELYESFKCLEYDISYTPEDLGL